MAKVKRESYIEQQADEWAAELAAVEHRKAREVLTSRMIDAIQKLYPGFGCPPFLTAWGMNREAFRKLARNLPLPPCLWRGHPEPFPPAKLPQLRACLPKELQEGLPPLPAP